jgi:hypothetical protein
MGLEKYTPYKSCSEDTGREFSATITGAFSPDFFNTNTIQLWDVSATANAEIIKWVGTTLADNSVHEITIVNNSNLARPVIFDGIYYLPDEPVDFGNEILLEPGDVAHYYAAATKKNGNLRLTLRTGSQTKRKKI